MSHEARGAKDRGKDPASVGGRVKAALEVGSLTDDGHHRGGVQRTRPSPQAPTPVLENTHSSGTHPLPEGLCSVPAGIRKRQSTQAREAPTTIWSPLIGHGRSIDESPGSWKRNGQVHVGRQLYMAVSINRRRCDRRERGRPQRMSPD